MTVTDSPELVIEVFQVSGQYQVTFRGTTPFGSTTGGTGRYYATAVEAVNDLMSHFATMANDPYLLGSRVQAVVGRLTGIECMCRTPGCDHGASHHHGPYGECDICKRPCWR